uniref:Uncharacterized protein n=1 Tax=Gossypium raimondii TaxID=29730 RepID=A0A0D2SI01_GOSRA|nr:hypothetical protein B456_005G159400 [Gossypium raimondii]
MKIEEEANPKIETGKNISKWLASPQTFFLFLDLGPTFKFSTMPSSSNPLPFLLIELASFNRSRPSDKSTSHPNTTLRRVCGKFVCQQY